MTPKEAIKHVLLTRPMQARGSTSVALLIAFTHPDFHTVDGVRVLKSPVAPPHHSEFLPYANGSPVPPDVDMERELVYRALANARATEYQFTPFPLPRDFPECFNRGATLGLGPIPDSYVFDEWQSHEWLTDPELLDIEWCNARRELCEALMRYQLNPLLIPGQSPYAIHHLAGLVSAACSLVQHRTLAAASLASVMHEVNRWLLSMGVRGEMNYETGEFRESTYGHTLSLGSMPKGVFIDKPLGSFGNVGVMCRLPLRRLATLLTEPSNPYQA